LGQFDQRGAERKKALVRARFRDSGLERDATIIDLSAQGLLLTAPRPPQPNHEVTIYTNGYSVTGHVRWVEERRFGISLDAPINVDDVIEAKALAPRPREAGPALPESFGAKPVRASASLGLSDYVRSKWVRYGMAAALGIGGAIYIGGEVGEVLGGMSQQMDAVQAVSGAEGEALKN
jgi:hypothetical protein